MPYSFEGVLTEAGLLPDLKDCSETISIAEAHHGDLLPQFIQRWRVGITTSQRRVSTRRAATLLAWLERQHSRGAKLTIGIPNGNNHVIARWLGQRLAWWPHGIPDRQRIGLLSSRLGRALDQQQSWFIALRAACARIDPAHDLLLTVPSTTTAPYAERSAQHHQLPVQRIVVPRDAMSLANWFHQIQEDASNDAPDDVTLLHLSPLLRCTPTRSKQVELGGDLPLRDRALVALSDRLFVFRVRRNGHVHQLVRRRLADAAWSPSSLNIAVGPQLVPAEMAKELLNLGAIGWKVPGTHDEEASDGDVCKGDASKGVNCGTSTAAEDRRASSAELEAHVARVSMSTLPDTVDLPDSGEWEFLTHCTRRQYGPWPDQAKEDFLDDLTFQREGADHSALSVLTRIVRQGRLVASPLAIRGAARVVSFTAIPLPQLGGLRTFRAHRGRWDFEPYGICIRRDWLEGMGARPVQYGDEDLWNALCPRDRAFFQIGQSRSRNRETIDWTLEQEWRHVSDIDLRDLPDEAGLLFVPSLSEAHQLATISRWPVTVFTHPDYELPKHVSQ